MSSVHSALSTSLDVQPSVTRHKAVHTAHGRPLITLKRLRITTLNVTDSCLSYRYELLITLVREQRRAVGLPPTEPGVHDTCVILSDTAHFEAEVRQRNSYAKEGGEEKTLYCRHRFIYDSCMWFD